MGKSILVLASLLTLAGCLGEAPSENETPPAEAANQARTIEDNRSAGAIWLDFENGFDGNISGSSTFTEFPFTLQAHWLNAEGLRTLRHGFELDLRHLSEGSNAAYIHAQGTTQGIDMPTTFPANFAAGVHVNTSQSPGTLVLVWSNATTPVYWEINGTSASTDATITEVTFGDVGMLGDSTSTANPVTTTTQASIETPYDNAIIALRVFVPSNGGAGSLTIADAHQQNTIDFAKQQLVSCIDCPIPALYTASLAGAGTVDGEFVGKTSSIAAYLTIIQAPEDIGVVEWHKQIDCIQAFQGCP